MDLAVPCLLTPSVSTGDVELMSRESASRARYSEQITSSNYQTGRQGKAVRGETLNFASWGPHDNAIGVVDTTFWHSETVLLK